MTTTVSACAMCREHELQRDGDGCQSPKLESAQRLGEEYLPATATDRTEIPSGCASHAPTDDELLGEPLSKLARRFGIPRSTLWTRQKALQRRGIHQSTCASLCTNWDDDLDDNIENPTALDEALGRGCRIQHGCWCDEGALSYGEYIARHAPESGW